MQNPVFLPAEILLPNSNEHLPKWAALACDQFTSQPEYWQKADEFVGAAPSTLRMILPEVYLEQPGLAPRIEAVHTAMDNYKNALLTNRINGYVYTERIFKDGSVRQGLVGCVDLDEYSYTPGTAPRIRPSENTVVERIPPRLAVRRGASLESPHILMLADNPENSIIEPIAAQKEALTQLYNVELMLGGGRVCGWAVTSPELLAQIQGALAQLDDKARFSHMYGTAPGQPAFALAVGDGNHSLATAKAAWEEVKTSLSLEEQATHPARFCLVELENIQSGAIAIEPIHRVIFNAGPGFTQAFAAFTLKNAPANTSQPTPPQNFILLEGERETIITAKTPALPLAVATAEAFLDEWQKQNPTARIDYVHDEESVRALVAQGAAGILLPQFNKTDIFRGVALGGVLPKKTFSMGHATQKRYYLECRRIVK